MAVKGSATVTLSQYRDTESVTRYYKLQSSSLAAPDKPTNVKPNETPAGWSKSEPACDITKTLYTCDVTVFSDKTTHVSDVSKSTSYEAAKEAWNKANNAQGTANEAKKYTDNALNNYGYQYTAKIEVAGDPNTYYPVMIFSKIAINQDVMREILVKRSYYEKAPAEWQGHTTAHGIALICKIKCNFGGWGGADYDWRIHELQEMYGHVFAGCEVCAHGLGFAIFLRGGGATYTLYSDMPLSDQFRSNPTTNVAPSIWYERGMFGWIGGTAENPEYPFYTPEPRTYTDAVIKEIHDRTYIKVATDAYDKAGTAQNTADKAQSAADKAQNTATDAYDKAGTAQNTADKAQNTATEAAKTADNYISADSTGIMVSENKGATKETPSNATKNNVLITEKDVQIRNGQEILASYGEVTTIGDQNDNYIKLSADGIELKDGTYTSATIKTSKYDQEEAEYTDTFDGSTANSYVASKKVFTCSYTLPGNVGTVKHVYLSGPNVDEALFIPQSLTGPYRCLHTNSDLKIVVDGAFGTGSGSGGSMGGAMGGAMLASSVLWSNYTTVTITYTKWKGATGVVNSDEVHCINSYATTAEATERLLVGGQYSLSAVGDVRKTFVVGKGDKTKSSNAAAILANGDLRLAGDVYVNCDLDSSGGFSLGSITYSTGRINLTVGNVGQAPKWWMTGNVVMLEVRVLCADSVASGKNIAVGDMVNIPKPINTMGLRSVSYYGNNPCISNMSTSGHIIFRNAGADALGKNNDAVAVFTYITDGEMIY